MLLSIPTIPELTNSILRLLNTCASALVSNLETIQYLIQFIYDKIAIASLQDAAVTLFKSISQESSMIITSNPEFAGRNMRIMMMGMGMGMGIIYLMNSYLFPATSVYSPDTLCLRPMYCRYIRKQDYKIQ